MNFLKKYYNDNDNQIVVTADQGSAFAKQIANDFNPIHDIGAKRFCVPGDLLFAIALNQYGLHKDMSFQFQELVKADTRLIYPKVSFDETDTEVQVMNVRNKSVLRIQVNGECSQKADQIEQLIKSYVAFSGHNFPHILVPLMEEHQVMINPQRPLVIYENMSLHFDALDFENLDIRLKESTLTVNGKRGDAKLYFTINSEGEAIGYGIKKLVLSGLREYQQTAVDAMCAEYSKAVSDNQ